MDCQAMNFNCEIWKCLFSTLLWCSFYSTSVTSSVIFAINFADGGFVSKKRKPVFCHSLVLTDIEGRFWNNRTWCCVTLQQTFSLIFNGVKISIVTMPIYN